MNETNNQTGESQPADLTYLTHPYRTTPAQFSLSRALSFHAPSHTSLFCNADVLY